MFCPFTWFTFVQEVWDSRVSLKENMTKMGVAFDANNVVPKISSKKSMVKDMKKKKGIEVAEEDGVVKRKSEVISRLEDEAKFEAKQTFRFTPTQVIPVQDFCQTAVPHTFTSLLIPPI